MSNVPHGQHTADGALEPRESIRGLLQCNERRESTSGSAGGDLSLCFAVGDRGFLPHGASVGFMGVETYMCGARDTV